MHWSPLIQKALTTAAQLHDGQYRKGPLRIPVLVHLVAVASMVSKCSDEEEVVAAALLHDTLEDTEYTREHMSQAFGEYVADLVVHVSIPGMHAGKEDETWGKDRQLYIEALKQAPLASIMIAAADKIHNFTSVVTDYKENPQGFKEDFTGKREDRLKVYGTIADLLGDRLGKEHSLAKELELSWKLYRDFVQQTL